MKNLGEILASFVIFFNSSEIQYISCKISLNVSFFYDFKLDLTKLQGKIFEKKIRLGKISQKSFIEEFYPFHPFYPFYPWGFYPRILSMDDPG